MEVNEFQKNVEKFMPADLKARYRDFKFIGQGGMGRIVSAHDTLLDKRVAIKLLPAAGYSDTAIVRFHQEAKAVSKLNHPNIVKVYDFGFAESGEPFLVMDFVEGNSLEDIIELNKTIPMRRAIVLGLQMCQALEHAHTNGVIHRDLKPANILIDKDGKVKVLDFGLAKLTDQNFDGSLTKQGQAIGSPLYMSPEQARGAETTEKADIFSLGLVLYKMVTGVVPNENENLLKILRGRIENAPPVLPPSETQPVLTDALDSILQTAMAVEPEERFVNMQEFRESLESLESVGEKNKEAEIVVPRKGFEIRKEEWRIIVASLAFLLTLVALFGFRIESQLAHIRPQLATKRVLSADDQKKNQELPGPPPPHPFVKDRAIGEVFWVGKTATDKDLELLRREMNPNLSLQFNRGITVKGMETISKLPVERLIIRETTLGDEAVPYINKLHLKALDLRGCRVTDSGVKQMVPSAELEHLDMDYLGQVTDASAKLIVSKFPNLRHINVGNTKMTTKGVSEFKRLPLHKLSVPGLKLTDKDLAVIINPEIQALDLEGNPITDKCIETLKTIKNLRYLSLDYCNISARAVNELRSRFKGIKLNDPMPPKQLVDDWTKIYDVPESIE